jgi:hypothetical protein
MRFSVLRSRLFNVDTLKCVFTVLMFVVINVISYLAGQAGY